MRGAINSRGEYGHGRCEAALLEMSAARKGSAVPSTSIEVAVELATLEPCDLRRAPLAASVLEVPLRFGIVLKRHGLRTWVGHAIHASVSRETARPRTSSLARQTLRSEGSKAHHAQSPQMARKRSGRRRRVLRCWRGRGAALRASCAPRSSARGWRRAATPPKRVPRQTAPGTWGV